MVQGPDEPRAQERVASGTSLSAPRPGPVSQIAVGGQGAGGAQVSHSVAFPWVWLLSPNTLVGLEIKISRFPPKAKRPGSWEAGSRPGVSGPCKAPRVTCLFRIPNTKCDWPKLSANHGAQFAWRPVLVERLGDRHTLLVPAGGAALGASRSPDEATLAWPFVAHGSKQIK